MHFSTITTLPLLLASTILALPTPDPSAAAAAAPAPSSEKAAAAALTCKSKSLTFDELGQSSGTARSLPNAGYDYNGLEFRENSWLWVSKGANTNGDRTADDRPVPNPPGYQSSITTAHSGTNSLMTSDDGYYPTFGASNYNGGYRYFDLKSLWVAPEYEEKAFSYKIECDTYEGPKRSKTFAVPKMAKGGMYQIKFPADWVHLWRCTTGATNLQQTQIDDFAYCLYEIPYGTTIPW